MEERNPTKLENSQNVLVRLWNLPSVNITVEVIGRTYTSAKSTNVILSSVCAACEQGLMSAGRLAVRTTQPAILVLQPQLIVANYLACQGLDHLEKKMLALEYPSAKIVAGMAVLLSSVIQNPAAQYILYTKLSHLAEEGTDAALTFTERLVNYILPASAEEREEEEACRVQEASAGAAGPRPRFVRLGLLAATVCRRAYGQTATQLQRTKRQGHQLVKSIYSLTPLLSGRSSKPREEILYCEVEVQKPEETKNSSDCSPTLKSNDADQKASHSHSPPGESQKEKDPTTLQPSEEVHFLHTKQILEENCPASPLES